LLNSKDNGFATSFLTAINILLLIISGPTALLGSKIFRTSITTCSLTTIVVKVFSITDLEDDGIDLPDFDDRGCNTLTTIVVSKQDVIDVLNILDPNKAVGPDIL
jgi:hypothetical protein